MRERRLKRAQDGKAAAAACAAAVGAEGPGQPKPFANLVTYKGSEAEMVGGGADLGVAFRGLGDAEGVEQPSSSTAVSFTVFGTRGGTDEGGGKGQSKGYSDEWGITFGADGLIV